MPVTGLEGRLAMVRAEMKRRCLVEEHDAGGLRWALTFDEAAVALGVSRRDVRRLVRLGMLHAVERDEPMIPASRLRAYQLRSRR